MSRAYYNENEPKTAAWLRELIKANLIAPGDVDERSITDVQPNDLEPYTQCHWFAGIAGWSLAMRLAGVADSFPVWTGSCPCQPFSAAGQGKGFEDARDLWPTWFRLIKVARPAIVFGEQVSHKGIWLDRAFADLESAGYACGAADLPAASVGAKHLRYRTWYVAHASVESERESTDQADAITVSREARAFIGSDGESLANAHSEPEIGAAIPRPQRDPWSPEPAVGRVVNGISHKLVEAELRAYGNSIVPQVAAHFIQASLEAIANPSPSIDQ